MSKYKIVESVGSTTQPVHSYEDIEIHHPSANKKGLRTGRLEDFERNPSTGKLRPHAHVDGEWEEIRSTSDGRTLVKKDIIFSQDVEGPVRVPCPVEGYLRYSKNFGVAEIYDGPGADAKLLGKVLHMKPDTFKHLDGKHVEYGQPLGVQWEAGRDGLAHAKDGIGIHAHVELEPAQFRRYISDIDKGVITPDSYSGKGRGQQEGARTEGVPRADSVRTSAERAVLKQGSEGREVGELQTALKNLGYRGADGQPLATDNDFGRNTDHAVREFQRAHGLEPVDGKVGPDTREALAQAAQRPLISEATHPNHDLFVALGRQLPEGTDPRVTANIAMQALENGITSPEQLKGVAVRGTDVHLQGLYTGSRLTVDLNAPTPDLQAMSDHMRQQTQERVQEEEQRRQQVQQPQALSA